MCDRSHLSQPRQHLLRVLNFLSAEVVFHKHRISMRKFKDAGVKVAFFHEDRRAPPETAGTAHQQPVRHPLSRI
jgi:hypothetical protein